MIIGLLIFIIGVIPIVLAMSSRRIFTGSELSTAMQIFMVFISIWQASIGVLYFKDVISKDIILFLFRLFRLAPTYAVIVVYYVTYTILKNNTITFTHNPYLNRFTKLFNKKVFFGLFIWSTMIYLINWTPLGIKGLMVEKVYMTDIDFFFPEYGPYNWLYMLHMASFLFFLFFVFMVSNSLQNQYTKGFLRSYSIFSLLLFVSGFVNFVPGTGSITSSIAVVIFSIMIMISFIKMNLLITLKYNKLLGLQKKMDYTGNLAGSLIHEVQNTLQVIKGFNKLLSESATLTHPDKRMVDMIDKATIQIEQLSNNYKEYIKFSKMDFKIEDLNKVIQEALDFSNEIVKDKGVTLQFHRNYNHLNAFVNKPYLEQVFINLIKNSAEAIPFDRKEKKVSIETEIMNECIYIHVKDTGIGIPISDWENVFDPFVSSKKKGMGMGLPFVRKIIYEHRGDINIICSNETGTHFQIRIPQYELSNLAQPN